MRRSVTASVTSEQSIELADDSFSELFHRMSGREPSAGGKSADGVARRQPVRPMAEAKARHAAEAVTLSYEQALRRHSRRRVEEIPNLLLKDHLPVPEPPVRCAEPPEAGKTAAAGHVRKIQKARQATVKPETKASKVPEVPSRTDQLARPPHAQSRADRTDHAPPRNQSSKKRLARSQTQQIRVAGKQVQGLPEGKSPTRQNKLRTVPQARKEAAFSLAEEALRRRRAILEGRNNPPEPSQKSAQTSARTPAEPRPTARSETDGMRRSIARAMPAAIQTAAQATSEQGLDQRRIMVSVRLSEEESQRLRLRAAESGISVSAYMRSCVLDAEHLRAQVKQALNEMRASLRRPEPAAAIQLAAQSSTIFGGGWFRVITRTAALFLGPLFTLRHRV